MQAPKEVQVEEGSTVDPSKEAAEDSAAVMPAKEVLPEEDSTRKVEPPEEDSTMKAVHQEEGSIRKVVLVDKANSVAEEDSMTVVLAATEAAEELSDVEVEEIPTP